MDRALEKGEKAIGKHSIFIKKKEYNAWMDETYLLMGKAQLYKLQYTDAIKQFRYVIKAYPEDPSKYKAQMWLLKTAIEMDDVVEVNDLLNKIEKDKSFPEELESERFLLMTHAHIKREEYADAILDLEQAIGLIKSKKKRTRPTFLLAQLYMLTGQRAKSASTYQEVLELRPDYKMAFYARINVVLNAVKREGGTAAVKAALLEMSEKKKYKEFYDQIYFALAEVCFERTEIEEGIGYLQKSAAIAAPDSPQRGKSYLRISDYYYDQHNYPLAKAYYDSTAASLLKSDPRYDEVIIRQSSLNALVKNEVIIAREDSLQALAGMDEKERRKLIENIIADIEAEEIAAREQAQALQQLSYENKQRNASPSGSQGNWYFYNSASINFGVSEFQQRWGDRSLEDDWRRANKSTQLMQTEMENLSDSTGGQSVSENKTVEFYLKDLPMDDASLTASNEKIKEALYGNGVIYREQLLDPELAAEQFKELERRFPKEDDIATALYQLYRIYTDLPDEAQREEYKQKILSQFPRSEYAKIVADPDYFEKQKNMRVEAERAYEAVYNQFQSEFYADVLKMTDQADSAFSEDPLAPKFALLRAMAYGGMTQRDSMTQQLVDVTQLYDGTPEAAEAQRILQAMGYQPERNVPAEQPKDSVADLLADSPYKYEPAGRHSVIIVVDDAKANINQLKVAVSNFNLKNFNQDKLKVSSVVYGRSKIISVKSFTNAEKAMAYYKAFMANDREIKGIHEAGYNAYAIAYSNYPTFYKEKDEEAYKLFFETFYMGDQEKNNDKP